MTERRQEIQTRQNTGLVDLAFRNLTWPTHDERNTDSAFVHLVLSTPQSLGPSHHVRAGFISGLIGFQSVERISGRPLVTGEDHDSVIRKLQFIQFFKQASNRGIQAPYISQVVSHTRINIQSPFISADIKLIGLHVGTKEGFFDFQLFESLGKYGVRRHSEVRNVGPDVHEEGPVLVPFDKVNGCIKGIIITTFGPIFQAIENFDLINTVVVGRLCDFRYFFTSDSGTDVPFPKMTCGIPVFIEQFGNGCPTIKTEISDPSFKTSGMPACHESDATWLAGYAGGVVACETRALFCQAVDMGRFRIRVTVASEVAVAQVIGKNENDVRLFLRRSIRENDCR